MSQWTHVNATIRFDSIPPFLKGVTTNDLGVISTFEKPMDTDIPYGSEGSISYEIVDTAKNTGSIARQVVVFYGDLRDYDNKEEILAYFTKIVQGKMVRSGILEIDVEYQTTQHFFCGFNEDIKKYEWKKI